MDKEWLYQKVKIFLYVFFGFAFTVILVRILLMALGANPDTPFVNFWYSLSGFFVGPFLGMYPNISPEGSNIVIEISSMIALIIYAFIFITLSISVTKLSPKSTTDRAATIVDFFFKIVILVLTARFLFKLTNASVASSFVDLIYDISAIFVEPFNGILPTYDFGTVNQFVFETSTLVAIIVVVIFDLVSSKMIVTLKNTPETGKKESDQEKDPTGQPQVLPGTGQVPNQQPIPNTQGLPGQIPNQYDPNAVNPQMQQTNPYAAQPQQVDPNNPNQAQPNLTLNINQTPEQQPNNTYVDKRTVNIVPGQEPAPDLPYNPDQLPPEPRKQIDQPQ